MNQQTQYWSFLCVCKALLKNVSELLFLAQYRNGTESDIARGMICTIKRLENRIINNVDLEGLLAQVSSLNGKDDNSKKAISVVEEDLRYLIQLHSSIKRS